MKVVEYQRPKCCLRQLLSSLLMKIWSPLEPSLIDAALRRQCRATKQTEKTFVSLVNFRQRHICTRAHRALRCKQQPRGWILTVGRRLGVDLVVQPTICTSYSDVQRTALRQTDVDLRGWMLWMQEDSLCWESAPPLNKWKHLSQARHNGKKSLRLFDAEDKTHVLQDRNLLYACRFCIHYKNLDFSFALLYV